jgi:hypothetical protein
VGPASAAGSAFFSGSAVTNVGSSVNAATSAITPFVIFMLSLLFSLE